MPDFSFEDKHRGLVCGIDEVGRGPLAGPVVAAAVVIHRSRAPKDVLAQINDSKKLTAKKRDYLFNKIHEFADVSVAECGVTEIDKINILQASLKAMMKAFRGLSTAPAVALIDGIHAPKLPCAIQTIVQGDGKSLSIAAASIIAKHYRDELMIRIANDFPHYGWERNAGYGTREHLKALEIHGVTIHHRRSFAPVFKQLVQESSANN
ncbi:MAG: ribonuclease HII [Alphaproteobacteria bacterium]|nr:ribonuclease HII [Alphaproteobacteria bacterium]